MLRELRVGNLALVEDLRLELAQGLTMLTGETGAGKSLVAGALSLLGGGKSDRSLVRTGEELAWVEGVFDLAASPQTVAQLNALGIRLEGDAILVLRREIRHTGRGRVLINGLVSSLTLLGQVGALLLSIQSQDQQRKLNHPDFARQYLDHALGLNHELETLQVARKHWQELRQQLSARTVEEEYAQQQIEMWQYQQRELSAMGLDPHEEDLLAEKLSVARNARALLDAAGSALALLSEGDNCTQDSLGRAESRLATVASSSTLIASVLTQLQVASEAVADMTKELEHFLDTVEIDPAKCDELESRKAEYENLRRKYQRDVDGLIALESDLTVRLRRQRSAAAELTELKEAVIAARDAVAVAASVLRERRVSGAGDLAARAVDLIRPLALPDLELEFVVTPQPAAEEGIEVGGIRCQIGPHGADHVSLRATTNPGEKGGEVAAIASGGEKSRIFLGLTVLAGGGESPCFMLFDEIDAGLGMDNAIPVAHLLKRMAADGQILCITHLATVAAHGEVHLKAVKNVTDKRTSLRVFPLGLSERLDEIARLLGGEAAVTQEGAGSRMAYARQLLARG